MVVILKGTFFQCDWIGQAKTTDILGPKAAMKIVGVVSYYFTYFTLLPNPVFFKVTLEDSTYQILK